MNTNTIEYEKNICVFIDILGFKNMVYNKSAENMVNLRQYVDNADNLINEIHKTIDTINNSISKKVDSEFKKIFKNTSPQYKKKVAEEIKQILYIKSNHIVISDSIIILLKPMTEKISLLDNKIEDKKLRKIYKIIHKLNIDVRIYTLFTLFHHIGVLQGMYALQNIWLRGAILYGDIYYNDKENQIFGQALIKATHLEKEADVPRIIIDESVLKYCNVLDVSTLIELFSKIVEGENILLNSHIFSEDAYAFIDYIGLMFFSKKTNYELSTIKEQVLNKISENKSYSKKFIWVKQYIDYMETKYGY